MLIFATADSVAAEPVVTFIFVIHAVVKISVLCQPRSQGLQDNRISGEISRRVADGKGQIVIVAVGVTVGAGADVITAIITIGFCYQISIPMQTCR